jgi:hypothetical protein
VYAVRAAQSIDCKHGSHISILEARLATVRLAIAQAAALLLTATAADDRVATLARARHVRVAALAALYELLDDVTRAAMTARAVCARLGARLRSIIAAVGSTCACRRRAPGTELASSEIVTVFTELARPLPGWASRHASVRSFVWRWLPQEALSAMEGRVVRECGMMWRKAVPAEGGTAATNFLWALHVLAPPSLFEAARDGTLAAGAPLEHATIKEGLEARGAAHLLLAPKPTKFVARDPPWIVRLRAAEAEDQLGALVVVALVAPDPGCRLSEVEAKAALARAALEGRVGARSLECENARILVAQRLVEARLAEAIDLVRSDLHLALVPVEGRGHRAGSG